MQLTPEQIDAYRRDGFLVFPDLVAPAEVAVLRDEVERLWDVEAEGTVREGARRAPKSMFRLHEADGANASAPFRALSRSPRVLGVAQQLLGADDLYLHHSKVNVKAAIEGSVWPWHQDFGAWNLDGIERPDMATYMVMLDDATELSGCLYMLPGSHRWGRTEAYLDTSTAYRLWSVRHDELIRRMRESPPPVAVTGRAGTCAIFHCNLMHASGHNLSMGDRWQAYFCFNTCANRPVDVANPRPDYVRSRNWAPMQPMPDAAVLAAAAPVLAD
ncbi:MAG: phytanoyl-CoA dioxygenase family protein [Burkholderiales bacterium]|nr:phytanoyl-CoA dioxygenase family protein [Burkholderiales bacterium]